jgi:hypothetical protein
VISAAFPGNQSAGSDNDNDGRIDEEVQNGYNDDRDYYVDLNENGYDPSDPIVLDNGTTPTVLDAYDAVLRGTVSESDYGEPLISLIDEDITQEIWVVNISSPICSAPG